MATREYNALQHRLLNCERCIPFERNILICDALGFYLELKAKIQENCDSFSRALHHTHLVELQSAFGRAFGITLTL